MNLMQAGRTERQPTAESEQINSMNSIRTDSAAPEKISSPLTPLQQRETLSISRPPPESEFRITLKLLVSLDKICSHYHPFSAH